MKKRLCSFLLAVVLLLLLLPTAALAEDEEVDYIEDLYISDLTKPTFGKKLDYDVTLRAKPNGRLITEGEKAPTIEWRAYNDYTSEYDLVTDKDAVPNARAYRLYIYMYPAEHCQFYNGTTYHLNGNTLDDPEGYFDIFDLEDNGVCLRITFLLSFDSAHTIRTVDYTDMPYCCVVGDRVDAFKPATLKDDGKTGNYFWYLEKTNSSGETIGMYIAKDQESTALKLMPELTKNDIAEMRQDFGTTFKSSYRYTLYNFHQLPSTYKYSDYVNVNITFSNGMTGVTEFYGGPKEEPAVWPTTMSAIPVQLENVKVTKPDAPILSLTKTDGKVKLSWGSVAGADKYWIYRSADGANFKYYDYTTKTSYTNSSVTSGTKYYYKVKAVNTDDGTDYISSFSNMKSTIPLTTPNLKASLSVGSAKLSWDAVTGVTKYCIYRSTDGKNFSYYDSTTKTSYTNTSVTAGNTYYYKVKAVKTVNGTDWTSDYSTAKSVKILKAPTLSISKTNGKVKLSWDAVSGAAKYYLYRSTDGTNFKFYDSTTNTSYTNSSVTSGTKYYYKVKAVNSDGGTGGYSAVKSTIPLTTPVVTAKLSSGKVYLSWESVNGATKYYIYRCTDGTNFKYYDSTTKTNYTNISVTEGNTYYYKVKAIKTVNSSDWVSDYSSIVSVER